MGPLSDPERGLEPPFLGAGLSLQASIQRVPVFSLSRKAKMMLDDIVSRGRGGPPGQFHDNANGGQNGTVQEIMIPAGKAGLVIGKGGETIKQLQVRVQAPPVPGQPPSRGCACARHCPPPPSQSPSSFWTRSDPSPHAPGSSWRGQL